MVVLLMYIVGYSTGGYWWLLMAIILVVVGGYSINGYWWLNYHRLLVSILLVVILL
jgi:hypothetical protein